MTSPDDPDYNGAPPPPQNSPGRRLLALVGELFTQAFAEYNRGEPIIWELSFQALPSPPPPDAPVNPETGQADPIWQPQLLIYTEIPGIVIRTKIVRVFPVPIHAWDHKGPEKAASAVQQIMRVLIEMRALQTEELQMEARQGQQNGNAATPPGLIIPGR